MSRWHLWTLHLGSTIVSLTGLIYFLMDSFLRNDDPFAVVNHPLQPWMLDVHVVSAPILVFVLGLVFESHVSRKLQSGSQSNRRTGIAALAVLVALVLSGYLLQVTTDEILHRAALVIHIVSGFLFVFVYAAHQVISIRLLRAAPVLS